MARLIFYLVLFLSYVSFSTAYTAYVPPSIVLNNKYIVDVEHEIRVGFRLFDASAINKDSKVIKYQNLQYTTNTPNVKFPRVVGNKNKLFFYGVNGNDVFETAIMFSFDINKKVWNELKDTNMPSHLNPNQEENFVGPDSDGNAYLLYNDNNIMLSFNTETLEWNEYLIQSFIPTGYAYYTWYTATILPDGNIAYIGGKFSNGTNYIDAPMNQFYTYNTKTHVWAAKSTIGTTPGARNCHSASLTSDGRIIIYGGVNANEQPATPSLAVLDINKYEWSTPIEENPIGPVYLAPSVIINDLMFLYLGVNVTSAVPNVFSKVYVLDTSTYAWSSLDPVVANSNDNIYSSGNNQITGGNANKNDLTMTLIIILIVISSILTLTILGVTFYKLYRSRRSRFSNQISPKVIDNSQQRSQV